MKKIYSVLVAFVMMLMLTANAFAANEAKFSVKTVNDAADSITVAVNYEGGTSFNALDLTLKFNTKKYKAESHDKGAGIKSFENKNAGGVLVMSNIKDDELLMSLAALNPYTNNDSKELFVCTFNKLNGAKVESGDFELTVTNCTDSNNTPIATSISSDFLKDMPTDNTATKDSNEADKPSDDKDSGKPDANATNDNTASNSKEESGGETNETPSNTDKVNDKTANTDKKKIVMVVAAAACTLLVIVAILVYVVQKTKNIEPEKGEDPLADDKKD